MTLASFGTKVQTVPETMEEHSPPFSELPNSKKHAWS